MMENKTRDEFLALISELPAEDQAKRILSEAHKEIRRKPALAISYAKYIQEHFDDEVLHCKAKLVMVEALFEQGHYDEAYAAHRECANLNDKLGYPIARGTLDNWQGLSLWRKGDLEKALESLFSALRYFEEVKDEAQLANIENNVGLIYWELRMDDEALRHYLKSLEIKNRIGDDSGLWALNNNIAGVYYRKGDLATAVQFMELVIEYFMSVERYREFSQISTNKAILMIEMGKFDEARDIMENIYKLTVDRNYQFEQILCLTAMGDLANRTDQLQEAEDYYNKAVKLGHELETRELLRSTLGHQSKFYERIGNYQRALEVFKELGRLKDELFHEQFGAKIAELESKFETEKKEKEMEIYRLKNVELVEANRKLKESYDKFEEVQQEIIELEKQKSAWAMAVTANHEINQPLMVIRGNMDLMRMKMDRSELPDDYQQYLENIEKSIVRITEILHKFKDQYPIRFTEYSSTTEMVIFDENMVEND